MINQNIKDFYCFKFLPLNIHLFFSENQPTNRTPKTPDTTNGTVIKTNVLKSLLSKLSFLVPSVLNVTMRNYSTEYFANSASICRNPTKSKTKCSPKASD